MEIHFKISMNNPGQMIADIDDNKVKYISYNVGETAIGIKDDSSITGYDHLILDGNWMSEYCKCKSVEDIIGVYRKNYKKHGSFWTGSVDKFFKK